MLFLSNSFDTNKVTDLKFNTVISKNNVGKTFFEVYREMKGEPNSKIFQSNLSIDSVKK